MSDREEQFSWSLTMQTIFFFLQEVWSSIYESWTAFAFFHLIIFFLQRKENQGFTGTACCQKDRLYWNRCFENLWKPAERCQNVHNTNQQFTDILCEFGVVSGKFRRNPQQRLSALGAASQLNRKTLVCSITECMILSCRREEKGKKKDFLLLRLYTSLSWNHQIREKDTIISS